VVARQSARRSPQERHDWGMKGNMDKSGATERVTAAAVEAAPGRGANYAFKDAQGVHYKCTSLPAK